MIKTARLEIKPFTIDQAQDFYGLTLDDGFNLHPITIYKQQSVEAARAWIERNSAKYGVWELASGELIGMGGLTPWEWKGENLVDITYRFRESAWGKGFGMEVAQALVEYGFNTLKQPQITATITPDNIGSKKIAKKLGMKLDQRIELLGVPTDLYRLFRK